MGILFIDSNHIHHEHHCNRAHPIENPRPLSDSADNRRHQDRAEACRCQDKTPCHFIALYQDSRKRNRRRVDARHAVPKSHDAEKNKSCTPAHNEDKEKDEQSHTHDRQNLFFFYFRGEPCSCQPPISIGAFLFPILLTVLTMNDSGRWIYACYFMLAMGILSFSLYPAKSFLFLLSWRAMQLSTAQAGS